MFKVLRTFLIVGSLMIFMNPKVDAAVRQENGDKTGSAQSEFYQPDEVQSVHLTISESDRRQMLNALPECIYVPATFQWRNVKLDKVAVRFKGNSSSQPSQKHKRSYLVRFDKYETNERFLGLRRVSFDNGVQFGSLFSEPVITEILKAEGIKSHRCNYATVYLNDEYQGVYVNVERIDHTFLESNFPNASGGLWKNDLGGPGGNLAFIGDDPKQYEKTFESKNKASKNRMELVEFIRKINQTSDEDFAAMLDSTMNVDQLFRITAVMLLSGAFDQLTGWNAHNFYLFHETERLRWHYLPWDLDVGFCETAFGRVRVLKDWDAAWPVPAGCSNPLLDRVISDPQLLNRYRTIAMEVLEQHFRPENICESIDKKYDLIKRHLEADPFPKQRATVPGDVGYAEIVNSMKLFMRKRYASAKQQLAQPGSRPVSKPQGLNNGRGVPAELIVKIQRVEGNAKQMQLKMRQLQQIMPQVNAHLQRGEYAEADRLLSKAIEISGGATEIEKR